MYLNLQFSKEEKDVYDLFLFNENEKSPVNLEATRELVWRQCARDAADDPKYEKEEEKKEKEKGKEGRKREERRKQYRAGREARSARAKDAKAREEEGEKRKEGGGD